MFKSRYSKGCSNGNLFQLSTSMLKKKKKIFFFFFFFFFHDMNGGTTYIKEISHYWSNLKVMLEIIQSFCSTWYDRMIKWFRYDQPHSLSLSPSVCLSLSLFFSFYYSIFLYLSLFLSLLFTDLKFIHQFSNILQSFPASTCVHYSLTILLLQETFMYYTSHLNKILTNPKSFIRFYLFFQEFLFSFYSILMRLQTARTNNSCLCLFVVKVILVACSQNKIFRTSRSKKGSGNLLIERGKRNLMDSPYSRAEYQHLWDGELSYKLCIKMQYAALLLNAYFQASLNRKLYGSLTMAWYLEYRIYPWPPPPLLKTKSNVHLYPIVIMLMGDLFVGSNCR